MLNLLQRKRGGDPGEILNTCLDSLGPSLHRVISKVLPSKTFRGYWGEAVLHAGQPNPAVKWTIIDKAATFE